MLEVIKRTATSSSSSGNVSATLSISAGHWEISGLSVSIGGPETIVAVIPLPCSGRVVYEQQDEQTSGQHDQARSLLLAQGMMSEHYRIQQDGSVTVKGPGRIKSYIQQPQSHEHTLSCNLRKVIP